MTSFLVPAARGCDLSFPASVPTVPKQHCWNCGRKASETCSGCNVARYCGAFCQHKDWENHHRVCGQQPSSSPSSSSCVLAAGKRSPSPPSAARRAEAKADVARH